MQVFAPTRGKGDKKFRTLEYDRRGSLAHAPAKLGRGGGCLKLEKTDHYGAIIFSAKAVRRVVNRVFL